MTDTAPNLTGSAQSRALAAASRAINAPSTFPGFPDFAAVAAKARRDEQLPLIAASLAGGIIAQRAADAPMTPAQAVALWREVLNELRAKNAPD